MNNHDRAKRIAEIINEQAQLHITTIGGLPFDEVITQALDATEPLTQEAYERLFAKPKSRLAFIGDEVRLRNESWRVIGRPYENGNIALQRGATLHTTYAHHCTHPDGAPVSRIIEHRRPISVSERLPTREDANAYGKVLTFWSDGDVLMAKWCAPALSTGSIVAWLPCPESGVK